MFPFEIYSKFTLHDMAVYFLKKDDAMIFTVIPDGLEAEIPAHRSAMCDTTGCREVAKAFHYEFPVAIPESMAQYKLAGDAYADQHAPGNTMRNSESVGRMKFLSQRQDADGIVTTFADERGLRFEQRLRHVGDAPYLVISSEVFNESGEPVALELLNSFSLGMLSPFQTAGGAEAYRIHRYRSFWSAEGRHEARTAEELGLEMSWQAAGARSVRFGQRSSMPVKEFFPAVSLEDTAAGVVWGAHLAAIGPWQLEVSRLGDFLNLSGGQIDREFGQWTKTLAPGESFRGPEAVVSCVRGSVETLNARLIEYQNEAIDRLPASEAELPILFNEWCTTWGNPSAANLAPIADRIAGQGIGYFVLDDGWFRDPADPSAKIGDWIESASQYPETLGGFCDSLRKRGFVPGIWFEFENCLAGSHLETEHPDWLLTLDGAMLKVGARRFLDFRKPEVWRYLDEKLIAMLKRNRIGYMKVDYNAAIPFGVDGGDSFAENLRQHLDAVGRYFEHVKAELPELVLEICASGGHRLTPYWMRLAAMGSFSDAHEGEEIPIIAANLQSLIPMRAAQVWATLRPGDDVNRLHYSLAAGFLGRLCLSGDLQKLEMPQLMVIGDAIDFYDRIKPLVRSGISTVERQMGAAWNTPRGYQLARRRTGSMELLVLHTFAGAPKTMELKLPEESMLCGLFKPDGVQLEVTDDTLTINHLCDFTAVAVLVRHPEH